MENTYFSEYCQKQTYDHKLVSQQMEKLFRKFRFIFSLKSNSAMEPDCLISALCEINALNVKVLLLATSTTIRPDPA